MSSSLPGVRVVWWIVATPAAWHTVAGMGARSSSPRPAVPRSSVAPRCPTPCAGPGEVLIEVVAAGVNRADVMQRQGHYPPPPGAPDYPGLECSGRIAALGDGVDGLVGRRRGVRPARRRRLRRAGRRAGRPGAARARAASTLVDAAALPEVACTVWSNVFMLAGLRPGETLLVHGGVSGIGTMAIQLGQRGRRPRGGDGRVGGEARRLPRARRRDPRQLPRGGLRRAGPGGDRRGTAPTSSSTTWARKYLARNVDVLAINGRLVVIGLQGGTQGRARPRRC